VGGRWFHSIDLGQGVVTRGQKPAAQLAAELAALRLPPLAGRTVLDIGAWDGYFSFAAERLGAARVVALDHYAWAVDWEARWRYETECRRRGARPRPWEEVPEVWHPDTLPGKRGFDTVHGALGSRVEAVVADFMAVGADELASTVGQFDVVLFLGVLYHLRDPFGALCRLAAVTSGVAVIETEVVSVPGYDRMALSSFVEGDELDRDPTNWWAPNRRALVAMCRAAGFRRVEANPAGWRGRLRRIAGAGRLVRSRAVVRAWR
jgi:tRNA (mo5U34)-methyltransferase